jgi:hypothetical protein
MRLLRYASMLAIVVALVGPISGCKVTSDDIQHWRRTVKGPNKLKAVLRSNNYEASLRAEAALALVDIERTGGEHDVHGLAELGHTLTELRAVNDPALPEIVAGMTPQLITMMRGAQNANHQPGQPTPPEQVRAKDAAFMLLRFAQGPARQQLIDAVVRWYIADFNARSLEGQFSVEQVVRELGAPAAAILVDAMNAHLAREALAKIGELVGQLADPAAKARAAERLVAIEQEMEQPAFVNWLKVEITRQRQGSNQPPLAEAQLQSSALLNRENFLLQGALPAMKNLADQAPVSARLIQIATTAPPADASPVLKAVLNQRRQSALGALEGHVSAQQATPLLQIALNANDDAGVRDLAFDRIADSRSRDAIPPMWLLVSATGQDATGDEAKRLARRLRWRAGELVLALGGGAVVPEFLSKLPSATGVEYEPAELEGYAQRIAQMSDAPVAAMRRDLSSSVWYRRAIAIEFLERRGTAEDIPLLERIVNDSTPTVGQLWSRENPPQPTVGKLATASLAALRQRLGAR